MNFKTRGGRRLQNLDPTRRFTPSPEPAPQGSKERTVNYKKKQQGVAKPMGDGRMDSGFHENKTTGKEIMENG